MKISHKISLCFFAMAVLAGASAYFVIGGVSRAVMQETIGENAVVLVDEVLDKIDREVYRRLETMQEYQQDLVLQAALKKSNLEYEQMENRQDYIAQKDAEWRGQPKEVITDFMKALIDNQASQELREKKEFYEERYGQKVYAEILIANKFGANAIQSQKSSDFYQYDEECFQKGQADGLWVSDVGYDESSDTHSIDFCSAIHDDENEFLGVMKVVLNIEDVIAIVKELEPKQANDKNDPGYEGFKSTHFKLLTQDGKIIYATKDKDYKEDSIHELGHMIGAAENGERYKVVYENAEEGEVLIAHTHSRGYKNYKGLGWILIVEYETKEVFAPVHHLKNIILMLILITMFLLMLVSVWVAGLIAKPLTKLKEAASEIGQGNLDRQVNVASRDEIGFLATAFNQMSKNLKSMKEADQARAEELKHSKEQADIATQAKSQFLANMSHEIRTPMNTIIGFSDLLHDTPLNASQKEYVDTIRQSGDILLNLINNILDLSRIEANSIQIETIPFDLRKLIEDAIKLVKIKSDEKNLKVVFEYTPGMPIIYQGDPSRIRQIVLNLVGNAIKFTDQGEIRVNVAPGSLMPPEQRRIVIITVSDTGIGVPQDKLGQIFHSFTQADETTSRKYGGSGLGLSISKDLAQKMGGDIQAESRMNQGSTFKLILPLKTADVVSSHPARAMKVNGTSIQGVKVLLVEDNPANLKLMKILLNKEGCLCADVTSGTEAIEKIKNGSFDICLMDVNLPGMSGLETVERIRKELKSTIPIIAQSAAVMPKEMNRALSSGMNDFLSKPVDREKLRALISKWVIRSSG